MAIVFKRSNSTFYRLPPLQPIQNCVLQCLKRYFLSVVWNDVLIWWIQFVPIQFVPVPDDALFPVCGVE